MMQDVHLKFQDCHGKSSIQQAEGFFSQIRPKFMVETSIVLYFEHRIVWC